MLGRDIRTDDRLVLDVIGVILRRQNDFLSVLSTVATHEAALDELRRSIAALAGARWEVERCQPRRIRTLAAFLPSNNILYSYVLFGMIPMLYADRILLRPSTRVTSAATEIHAIFTEELAAGEDFPVRYQPVSQRKFLTLCRDADAVVFNGQPDNAISVGEQMRPRTAFLAFGSGPNPVVVGAGADLRHVTRELMSVRFYNSGQDCLCPDAVFVHESVADDLIDELRPALSALRLGKRAEVGTQVAPLTYPDAVVQAKDFFDGNRHHILHGGKVTPATGEVEPTLIDLPWSDDFHPPEFFAPVLCLVRYQAAEQISRWLAQPEEAARGMYLSRYGERELERPLLSTTVVLNDRTTLDAEDGNQPLGGYGTEASHVRRNGVTAARPLLLSAELGAAPPAAWRGPDPC